MPATVDDARYWIIITSDRTDLSEAIMEWANASAVTMTAQGDIRVTRTDGAAWLTDQEMIKFVQWYRTFRPDDERVQRLLKAGGIHI